MKKLLSQVGSESNEHIVSKWQPLLVLSCAVGAITKPALVWSVVPLHLLLYITLWWKLSQCASLGTEQSVIYQSAILLMNWKTNPVSSTTKPFYIKIYSLIVSKINLPKWFPRRKIKIGRIFSGTLLWHSTLKSLKVKSFKLKTHYVSSFILSSSEWSSSPTDWWDILHQSIPKCLPAVLVSTSGGHSRPGTRASTPLPAGVLVWEAWLVGVDHHLLLRC